MVLVGKTDAVGRLEDEGRPGFQPHLARLVQGRTPIVVSRVVKR